MLRVCLLRGCGNDACWYIARVTSMHSEAAAMTGTAHVWHLMPSISIVLIMEPIGQCERERMSQQTGDHVNTSPASTNLSTVRHPNKVSTHPTVNSVEATTNKDDADDDDTQGSPSNNCRWPGLTGVREGVMTPRKRVCKSLVWLALLARCALAHCR